MEDSLPDSRFQAVQAEALRRSVAHTTMAETAIEDVLPPEQAQAAAKAVDPNYNVKYLFTIYEEKDDPYLHVVLINKTFWETNKAFQPSWDDVEVGELAPIIKRLNLYETCSGIAPQEYETPQKQTVEGFRQKLLDSGFGELKEFSDFLVNAKQNPGVVTPPTVEEFKEYIKQLKMANVSLSRHIDAISTKDDRKINASVSIEAENEKGEKKTFTVRAVYTDSRGRGMVEMDLDKDLNKDDLKLLLDWMNEQTEELNDYTLKGPAYQVDRFFFRQFAISRFCADQLHACVVDTYLDHFDKIKKNIVMPKAAAT
jgi:hypothetical protein